MRSGKWSTSGSTLAPNTTCGPTMGGYGVVRCTGGSQTSTETWTATPTSGDWKPASKQVQADLQRLTAVRPSLSAGHQGAAAGSPRAGPPDARAAASCQRRRGAAARRTAGEAGGLAGDAAGARAAAPARSTCPAGLMGSLLPCLVECNAMSSQSAPPQWRRHGLGRISRKRGARG